MGEYPNQVVIHLSSHQLDKIDEIKDRDKTSRSKLIRGLVEEYLKKREIEGGKQEI